MFVGAASVELEVTALCRLSVSDLTPMNIQRLSSVEGIANHHQLQVVQKANLSKGSLQKLNYGAEEN